jgi:hypothetical protein
VGNVFKYYIRIKPHVIKVSFFPHHNILQKNKIYVYNAFIFVMNWNFFFVKFFYKIYENSTVGNDLKCHIIVTAKMNAFPKRSKASIYKIVEAVANVFSVNPNLK